MMSPHLLPDALRSLFAFVDLGRVAAVAVSQA
jgi:hypothetical protein